MIYIYMRNNAKAARAYVAARDSVQRVRITKNGEVLAYGAVPDTNETGWYFAGYVDDLAKLADAEYNSRLLADSHRAHAR